MIPFNNNPPVLLDYIKEFEQLNEGAIVELLKNSAFQTQYQFIARELLYIQNCCSACLRFAHEEILKGFRRYVDLIVVFSKYLADTILKFPEVGLLLL